MSDSSRCVGATADHFEDETTDREFLPIEGLAKRLPRMTCVRLDDGAWWEED